MSETLYNIRLRQIVSEDIAQASPEHDEHMIVPLSSILQLDLPSIERLVGKNERLDDTDTWHPDACIAFGQWAVGILAERVGPPSFTTTDLKKFRCLGLGPSARRILRHFGAYSTFLDQFRPQYAPPTSLASIRRPYRAEAFNFAEWVDDDADFVTWCIKAMQMNPDRNLDETAITILFQRKCGPSLLDISERFGSLDSLLETATAARAQVQAAETARQEHLLDQLYALIDEELLPSTLKKSSVQEQLRVIGQWKVARKCLPTSGDTVIARMAQQPFNEFFTDIRIRTIKARDIELAMVELGVSDYIWSSSEWEDLRISEDERAFHARPQTTSAPADESVRD